MQGWRFEIEGIADLGFSPKKAKALLADADARIAEAQRLKVEAATAIAQWIQAKETHPGRRGGNSRCFATRVSDLVNLKLGRFSLDTLVAMLLRAGKNVDLVVR